MSEAGREWFSSHARAAVEDFFDVCEHNSAVNETSARALEQRAGEPLDTTIAEQTARASERMRLARAGDWSPFERHLQTLGQRFATTGLEFAAWFAISNQFYATLVPRLTTAFAADSARLEAVLLVLGTYMERSLAVISTEYLATKDALLQRAESRADESAALWSHALEQADFGVVVSNLASREIRRANPAYERLLGYGPGELLGVPGDRLLAPRSRAQLALAAVEPRAPSLHNLELYLQRKDGTDVRVLTSTSIVGVGAGDAVRVSTCLDMSAFDAIEQARGEAQRALVAGAARLEVLSTTAHEFAASSGHRDELLALVARRCSEVIGDACSVRLLSDDQVWLEPSTAFFHPDPELCETARAITGRERQRVGEGIGGTVIATGTAIAMPVVDPAQFHELTTPQFRDLFRAMPVHGVLVVPLQSKGRTIGVVSLLRTRAGAPYTVEDQRLAQDLADRAGLAIDNAVLVANLERRVLERTAALEVANDELEAFSYTVSHDLRSPLRAIDGFSRALLSDYSAALDTQGQHFLNRIRAGTQRMSSLIDDLLALARITRVPLHLGGVDLSAIAEEVIGELKRGEPHRTVLVHIEPGLKARADAKFMRIVLENLLGNAWKFTSKRPDAEVRFGVHEGAYFVKDTGAGFDMNYADKLFVPFQRLHAAGDFEGTGVGLATVQRIVGHHRGRIWAESKVAHGATFYFTLGGQP